MYRSKNIDKNVPSMLGRFYYSKFDYFDLVCSHYSRCNTVCVIPHYDMGKNVNGGTK